jgi:hypothetical protein
MSAMGSWFKSDVYISKGYGAARVFSAISA